MYRKLNIFKKKIKKLKKKKVIVKNKSFFATEDVTRHLYKSFNVL